MAVLERSYKRFQGPLSPEWSRFLIIPRHAYRDVFRSKLFTTLFVICFVPILVEAILIYLHHNTEALGIFKAQIRNLLPIDATFFQTFVDIQGGLASLLTVLVGPPLVARDLTNNALPLYLCRPFSRTEYVVGKMSVLLILLSAITWVPGVLMFLFQSYLEGFGWFGDNVWLASAIFLSSLMWILLLTLLSQTISALVKWRLAASAALIGLYLIPSVFAEIVNGIFGTRWGHILSIEALRQNVTSGLFGTLVLASGTQLDGHGNLVTNEPPSWVSWFAVFLICAICLAVLSRCVKAYEVVK